MSILNRRLITMLLAATAAVAVGAGCGGDSGGGGTSDDDAKDIAAVAERALTTTDPQVKCVEVVTRGFVRKVYGDLATCKAAEVPDSDDNERPTAASTSAIDVDGDVASATVAVRGGDTDGASGMLDFEKEDGTWKVSGLGANFLRSQLEKSLASEDDPGSPFATPAARDCVLRELGKLEDEKFVELAYSGIAEKPAPELVEALSGCASEGAPDTNDDGGEEQETGKDASTSLLRRQFESGIRSAARKDGATEKEIDCVLKALRRTISEDDIVEQVGRGKDDVSSELSQRVARAIQTCG